MEQTPESGECPAAVAAAMLGDKWKTRILLSLARESPGRFLKMRRALGDIHHKSLARSLRELEADGLVIRTQYAGWPLRVEYELSDRGNALIPILKSLDAWQRTAPAAVVASVTA